MIMEYLLINHPLDCPVCDQAGQCGLQDYSFEHGQAVHRFVEERIVNPRKEVSERIQLNQDRCIMCTRCVRFTREITGTSELLVTSRGSHAEIGVFPGQPLDNPLAGNVVDLCPVGALLDKDFLHKQRFWFLSKHESICTRCSTGCNITAEENRGRLWRFRARWNPHVNDYWICDLGRYSYEAANDPALLTSMAVRRGSDLVPVPMDEALAEAGRRLREAAESGGRVAAILSPFLTVEEAYLLARYVKGLGESNTLAIGPVPVQGEDVTIQPDKHAGRAGDVSFIQPRPFVIRAEKCPNRAGVEIILRHFQGEVIRFETLAARVASGEFAALVATSSALDPAYSENDARTMRPGVACLVVSDSMPTPLGSAADVLLSSACFAEKAGTYVNATGRLQYAAAALPPREGSLPDLDLWTILTGEGSGPARSGDALEQAAREVPALAPAAGGRIPAFGIDLSGLNETNGAARGFADPWLEPRSARGDRAGANDPRGGQNV
jgi:NADH-quinone oxidoreductase subunit G